MTKSTATSPAMGAFLKQIRSIKATTRGLKSHDIVDISKSMTVERMPIAQFMAFIKDVPPVDVQRNDLYRLNNRMAEHLDTFMPPQASVAIVLLDGKPYMVDGNTRKRKWLASEGGELPSHVFVTIMEVESHDTAMEIYECYDSNKAKKTARDTILSLMHNAGLIPESFISPLVAGGKVVSALKCMTRLYSGGSATKARMQEVITLHKDAIVELDRLNLNEGQIPSGGVWALLSLYSQVDARYHEFVTAYAQELRKLGTKFQQETPLVVQRIAEEAKSNCIKAGASTTGEKAVPLMHPAYLKGAMAYFKTLSQHGQLPASFTRTLPKLQVRLEDEVSRAERLRAKVAA